MISPRINADARGFFVLVLVLVLGCSRSDDDASGPVRLVFKHQRLGGEPGALERILARFEAARPDVRVVSEDLPAASDVQHQFYVTSLEGGSRDIDVLSIDVIWAPEFARAGWLLDLSARLPPERLREAFFPAPVEAVTWGGRTWAVPWFVDAGLLYSRTDLLEKHGVAPPRTFAEIEAAARRVLDAERSPRLKGFVWQGRQYEGLVCNVLEAERDLGGRVPALATLRRFLTTGISPPLTTSADEETCRAIFERGEAVFMRNWPYAISLLSRESSPVRGRFAYTAMPGGGTLGGWQLAVNARVPDRRREAAVALVEHLTSREAQLELERAFGLNPPRPDCYEGREALRDALAAARPRPVTPYYLMIADTLQSELSGAIAGIRTPEEAARRIDALARHLTGEAAP